VDASSVMDFDFHNFFSRKPVSVLGWNCVILIICLQYLPQRINESNYIMKELCVYNFTSYFLMFILYSQICPHTNQENFQLMPVNPWVILWKQDYFLTHDAFISLDWAAIEFCPNILLGNDEFWYYSYFSLGLQVGNPVYLTDN
jgi:hypothetical protein